MLLTFIKQLIAKDVMNKKLSEKVNNILTAFKGPDLEKEVVERGDSRIKLLVDRRWNLFRNSQLNLKKNLPIMQEN